MRRTALVALAASVGTVLVLGVLARVTSPDRPDPRVLAALADSLEASTPLMLEETTDQDGSTELQGRADPEEVSLQDIWLENVIRGTGPEIALRFMQALQRHDEIAAFQEMANTLFLSRTNRWTLHHVLDDVRQHADLEGAGRCTRAKPFSQDHVIVSCGALRVIVTVYSDSLNHGVDVWKVPTDRGEYRYPHSYAFSTVDI